MAIPLINNVQTNIEQGVSYSTPGSCLLNSTAPLQGSPDEVTWTDLLGVDIIGIFTASAYIRCVNSDATVSVRQVLGGGAGTPGGSNTQVQYNNAGTFGGITGATSNGTTLTLVAPILGTPASVTLTNATGLPVTTGISGLGTGVATALGVNVGSAGSFVKNAGTLANTRIAVGTAADTIGGDSKITWDGNRLNLVSTGDTSPHVPYTLANSSIRMTDANGEEVFRLWATDPDPGFTNFNAWNLYIGSQAGASQPSDNVSAGFCNTGIGKSALAALTTGAFNTAVGSEAGKALTTSQFNSFFGRQAGLSVTDGEWNTLVGGDTGKSITTGDRNSCYGVDAGYYLTTGSNNTFIGVATGNTLADTDATHRSISDTYCVFIGENAARINAGAITNSIAIGKEATVTASNTGVIGNSSVTDVYFGSTSGASNIHSKAVLLHGATSGVVTVATADVAGTWTLKLPTNDGDAGQFLQTDGSGNTTWAAGGGGITIGSTTITGGTSTRILYNNAGVVGEYTLTGTGTVAVMQTAPTLTGPVTVSEAVGSSGLTITGATQTTNQPFINATQTWNAAGVAFRGIQFTLTNTASASGSAAIRVDVSGTSGLATTSGNFFAGTRNAGANEVITLTGTGSVRVIDPGFSQYAFFSDSNLFLRDDTAGMAYTSSGGLQQKSAGILSWSSTGNWYDTNDLFLRRDAAAVLAQYNGTNAQTIRIYETRTDASNYERGSIALASDTLTIAWESAGTGAANGSIALTPKGSGGVLLGAFYQQFTEMTAPAAGAANTVRIYAEDNGAGKTRLMALFNTGAAQQIAIEP